ncbi:hypothetical protein, conserved [Eimeria tenella]|uniref:Uncharacterized protein n=1 Tax=Eimeria tenella TaxID=5802 RepID=U6KNR3_EIMTE|nr:hypothetical protein, conserved [Eimeria tenella]CDJ38456.1 hypothetical protein, conserved [Eimeria tenella]|eukprot:XP_013229294.1 hypothetical protein, conserved [Eimeria tenella]
MWGPLGVACSLAWAFGVAAADAEPPQQQQLQQQQLQQQQHGQGNLGEWNTDEEGGGPLEGPSYSFPVDPEDPLPYPRGGPLAAGLSQLQQQQQQLRGAKTAAFGLLALLAALAVGCLRSSKGEAAQQQQQQEPGAAAPPEPQPALLRI